MQTDITVFARQPRYTAPRPGDQFVGSVKINQWYDVYTNGDQFFVKYGPEPMAWNNIDTDLVQQNVLTGRWMDQPWMQAILLVLAQRAVRP